MTKANQFFAGSTTGPSYPQPAAPTPPPPKYVTERQGIYNPSGVWQSCDLYSRKSSEYHAHMRQVQNSPLPAFRKCRFRVRRLSDSKVMLTGQHISLTDGRGAAM